MTDIEATNWLNKDLNNNDIILLHATIKSKLNDKKTIDRQ